MGKQETNPHLAITMGDPAGIGPEICLKALSALSPRRDVVCKLYGDAHHLKAVASQMGLSLHPDSMIDTGHFGPYPSRSDSKEGGLASAAAIEMAVAHCKTGILKGIVTAPISKRSLKMAGLPWPGHTEFLAHLSNPNQPPAVRMALINKELRVLLHSIHLPLKEAIQTLTIPDLLETFKVAKKAAALFGLKDPRIALASLNPHASEAGQFGSEEQEILSPAIKKAAAAGISILGPVPADTVFMRARVGHDPDFDLVIALYHDQGLIPIKLNGLDAGVNITVGLPFVRASVDHGTAFDIVGRNLANPSSLICAIDQACKLLSIPNRLPY
jgi:4-hydroxythreonine-4-phosphate dehydrogenase